jgi:O-antigen/teichoic acid export membrane protein
MNPLLQKIQAQLRRPGLWNIGRLLSASVFAQVLSIGIAPIVTRLYSKEDYGFLAIVISVSSILGTFATLQYHQTILLPKEDEEAKLGTALSLYLSAALSGLVLVLYFVCMPFLSHWFNFQESYTQWFLVLPVLVLLSGFSTTISIWANRKQQYKLLSRSRITASIATSVTTVGLGWLLDGPTGLIVGFTLNYVILSIMLWFSGINRELSTLPMKEFSRIKTWAKQNAGYPLMTLPSEFVNMFINQLPVFLLTTLKGAGEAGLFSLCNRVLATPVNMVASATGEFFRQKAASEYAEKGECQSTFTKITLGLAGISIVPFAVLGVFSPALFAWIFGEEWRQAGEYAQVLSALFFFKFVVSPVSFMYYIANRLKEDLLVHVYLIASTLGLFVFLKSAPTEVMLAGYVVNYILVYIFVGWRSWHFSKGEKTTTSEASLR